MLLDSASEDIRSYTSEASWCSEAALQKLLFRSCTSETEQQLLINLLIVWAFEGSFMCYIEGRKALQKMQIVVVIGLLKKRESSQTCGGGSAILF